MVKPQFEVGRERVGAGGVVRDPRLRAEASARSPTGAYELGLGTAGDDRAARCPGRPATSSSSSGCAATRRRWTRPRSVEVVGP